MTLNIVDSQTVLGTIIATHGLLLEVLLDKEETYVTYWVYRFGGQDYYVY